MIHNLEDVIPYIKKNSTVVPSGCWEWNLALNSVGYGQMKFQGKFPGAHRMSYQAFKGPIPNGLFVCHTCDNRKCVNPDHLWVGTNQDNQLDLKSKGYKWKGRPRLNNASGA